MKNYFFWDESPYEQGKFLLKPDFDLLPLGVAKGSYHLLAARVAGLSYANYLRACRDKYGATLIGKNCVWVLPYFDKPNAALSNELNKRVELLLKEKI